MGRGNDKLHITVHKRVVTYILNKATTDIINTSESYRHYNLYLVTDTGVLYNINIIFNL